MPKYRYLGDEERVLTGLSHGVNATVEDDQHHTTGATVTVRPGDEVTTREPYQHALLDEVDADVVPLRKRPGRKSNKPAPAEPSATENQE